MHSPLFCLDILPNYSLNKYLSNRIYKKYILGGQADKKKRILPDALPCLVNLPHLEETRFRISVFRIRLLPLPVLRLLQPQLQEQLLPLWVQRSSSTSASGTSSSASSSSASAASSTSASSCFFDLRFGCWFFFDRFWNLILSARHDVLERSFFTHLFLDLFEIYGRVFVGIYLFKA